MTKLTACRGYSDENGNRVIGSLENCNVIFLGKNSTLKVGDNFIAKNMTIRVNSDCCIEIGSNVMASGSLWNFYDNAHCSIGSNCRFRDNGFLSVCPYAQMLIGQGFTVECDYIMIALPTQKFVSVRIAWYQGASACSQTTDTIFLMLRQGKISMQQRRSQKQEKSSSVTTYAIADKAVEVRYEMALPLSEQKNRYVRTV